MSHDSHDAPPRGSDVGQNAHAMALATAQIEESLETATAQAERLLGRLRSVDFVPYEAMAARDALPHLRSGPVAEVRHALGSTLKLLRTVSRIAGAQADFADAEQAPRVIASPISPESTLPREGVPQPMVDGYVELLEGWLSGDGIAPGGLLGPEGPAQTRTLARMLETMAAHIGQAQAFLLERDGHGSKWGLIAAGEEGRRKARRTVRAAMLLTTRLMQPARALKPLSQEPDALAESLLTRELIMRARADLMALVDVGLAAPDSELGPHMREVRMRFVQLVGASGYSELRVADRHAIGLNIGEISSWISKPWDDFAAARQILNHVAETGLRLGAINLRGNLMRHDRATQVQALALLASLDAEAETARAKSPAAPAAASSSTQSRQAKAPSKPRVTPQQRRLSQVATLVGSMRWRSQELQQFFDSITPVAADAESGELALGQVGPLAQMVRRAMS